MGYTPPRKTYHLDFSGTDLHGLEVSLRSLNVGELADLMELQTKVEQDPRNAMDLFTLVAKKIVKWNVEDDDGNPVPSNLEGLREQDLSFVMALIKPWVDAMASIPLPLEQNSTGGPPSAPAPPIPMETLSLSRAS
ncbi:hypothetical protein [Streptomyces pseudogriseolus]|uniref:hypothetical protein n=1 Tax=Streptomyces pseudogriseolus TaxID=36817 RepID=UPI003FA1DE3F